MGKQRGKFEIGVQAADCPGSGLRAVVEPHGQARGTFRYARGAKS